MCLVARLFLFLVAWDHGTALVSAVIVTFIRAAVALSAVASAGAAGLENVTAVTGAVAVGVGLAAAARGRRAVVTVYGTDEPAIQENGVCALRAALRISTAYSA
jgi:hypothetical protein